MFDSQRSSQWHRKQEKMLLKGTASTLLYKIEHYSMHGFRNKDPITCLAKSGREMNTPNATMTLCSLNKFFRAEAIYTNIHIINNNITNARHINTSTYQCLCTYL